MKVTAKFGDQRIDYVEKEKSPYSFCVLKHLPRGNDSRFDPDEIFLQDRPVGTGMGVGIPFQAWWGFVKEINKNNAGAWEWLTTYEAMWFNNDQDPNAREIDITKPINIRCTDGGGNLRAYYPETQTNAYIELVGYDYLHPELLDASVDNFNKKPEMFCVPSAINLAGVVRKVANGITVFMPRLYRTKIWIRKSEVIFLKEKPTKWTIEDVLMTNAERLAFSG